MQAVLRADKIKKSVRWPAEGQPREACKKEAAARSILEWRGGWCGVDGTTVPLSEKPYLYGPAWFNRKGRYSMNVQIVTDHQMNIIDFSVGRTGSRCDSVAFEDTRLADWPSNTRTCSVMESGAGETLAISVRTQNWLVLPFTRPLKD
ncbi:hypothetical protein CF327_g7146 [Tilletia walkeri]|nr:hypothetical protein CF327_g7146 [Tilletia walkeri]